MNKTTLIITLLFTSSTLSGCIYDTRPKFTSVAQSVNNKMANRIAEAPIVKPKQQVRANGSLWQKGSAGFFKDNRAKNIGDIVTVVISENTEATVKAITETTRKHNALAGVGKLLNLTGMLQHSFITDPTGNLLKTDSNRVFKGDGSTERTDALTGSIAAMVTEVLPNGYLVIQGQREILVNYEMQQMSIRGIIRITDITSENTIPSGKVAEARIAYAGRGMVDEAQETQPAIKFIDKWLPF